MKMSLAYQIKNKLVSFKEKERSKKKRNVKKVMKRRDKKSVLRGPLYYLVALTVCFVTQQEKKGYTNSIVVVVMILTLTGLLVSIFLFRGRI